MTKKLCLTLLLLLISMPTWAELNTTEKGEVKEALQAGEKIRDGSRDIALAVRYGTTTESRAALATLQTRYLDVLSPLNVVPIYLLHGSVSGFINYQLSPECNTPNEASRSVYINCAWLAADIALSRVQLARNAIVAARAYNIGQTNYQNALNNAETDLNTAESKLLGVNRTLAYADPSPSTEVTVTGLAWGTGVDAGRIIGPHGPYAWTMAQFGRATGEYSTSTADFVIDAYPFDALLSDYVDYEFLLRSIWFAQDDYFSAMQRFARIQGNEPGEVDDPSARVNLQRAIRRIAKADKAPGNFYVIAQRFKSLVIAGATRPNFLNKIAEAQVNAADAWHRGDDSLHRMMIIPEIGIE